MSTTTIRDRDRLLSAALSTRDLPRLTTTDRIALRLGLALILRGQRRAEHQDRAEQARRNGAAARAARSRDTTFALRHQTGSAW